MSETLARPDADIPTQTPTVTHAERVKGLTMSIEDLSKFVGISIYDVMNYLNGWNHRPWLGVGITVLNPNDKFEQMRIFYTDAVEFANRVLIYMRDHRSSI